MPLLFGGISERACSFSPCLRQDDSHAAFKTEENGRLAGDLPFHGQRAQQPHAFRFEVLVSDRRVSVHGAEAFAGSAVVRCRAARAIATPGSFACGTAFHVGSSRFLNGGVRRASVLVQQDGVDISGRVFPFGYFLEAVNPDENVAVGSIAVAAFRPWSL